VSDSGSMRGGREVRPFIESISGPMPDTAEYSAIKNGRERQSKSFPGAGSVRFVAYLWREIQKYAIIRSLETGFDVPKQHRRFVVEGFEDYETAVSNYGLAVGWLVELVELHGHGLFDEETLAQMVDSLTPDAEADPR
jgi:hypothetical protein